MTPRTSSHSERIIFSALRTVRRITLSTGNPLPPEVQKIGHWRILGVTLLIYLALMEFRTCVPPRRSHWSKLATCSVGSQRLWLPMLASTPATGRSNNSAKPTRRPRPTVRRSACTNGRDRKGRWEAEPMMHIGHALGQANPSRQGLNCLEFPQANGH